MPHTGPAKRIELDKVTLPDIVVIVCILVLSTGLIAKSGFGFNGFSGRTTHSGVSIYHEGKLLERISLASDREVALLGERMLLEVKEGRLRVKRSECHRQVCVHVGWIHHPGEAIICVPNKIVIELGSHGTAAVDAVVF